MKTIRFMRDEDIKKILAIYEPYITDTTITFECNVPSLEEFTKRTKAIASDYPYLVCLSDDKIVGYAYAHKHHERDAYQWNAELSVYIHKDHMRCGIGKTFYNALMDILKLQNIRNVYGCVTMPNENSERFHEAFGFRRVGEFVNTGYKLGGWLDVVWFEKAIGLNGKDPEPIVSITELDRELLDDILDRYNTQLN